MSEAFANTDDSAAITPKRALAYFFYLADGHSHSAARVAASLLLSCYNGHRFQFDVTDLRLLDSKHFEMAIQIMRLDARCTQEVHEHLNTIYARTDFGPRFEWLAWKFNLKGKCKRDWIPKFAPVTFADPLTSTAAH